MKLVMPLIILGISNAYAVAAELRLLHRQLQDISQNIERPTSIHEEVKRKKLQPTVPDEPHFKTFRNYFPNDLRFVHDMIDKDPDLAGAIDRINEDDSHRLYVIALVKENAHVRSLLQKDQKYRDAFMKLLKIAKQEAGPAPSVQWGIIKKSRIPSSEALVTYLQEEA